MAPFPLPDDAGSSISHRRELLVHARAVEDANEFLSIDLQSKSRALCRIDWLPRWSLILTSLLLVLLQRRGGSSGVREVM